MSVQIATKGRFGSSTANVTKGKFSRGRWLIGLSMLFKFVNKTKDYVFKNLG